MRSKFIEPRFGLLQGMPGVGPGKGADLVQHLASQRGAHVHGDRCPAGEIHHAQGVLIPVLSFERVIRSLSNTTGGRQAGCPLVREPLGPYPPPPGVSTITTSPRRASNVALAGSGSSTPPRRRALRPGAPAVPPARPHGPR